MTFIGTPAALRHGAGNSNSLLDTAAYSTFARYDTLDVTLEAESRTHWCRMQPLGRPCFNMDILRDLSTMQQRLRGLFAAAAPGAAPALYHVLASRTPGVFNLGGDLGHFAERIRAGDRATLRRYGEACIRTVHDNAIAYDLPLVTVALVQGDALGGGFECALAFDVIVAERRAKFGLPEIIFNLFPGMGAYSFLARRIGTVAAEKMIMSGRLYSAEELHAMGVVDVLAEDGEGEVVVRQYIAQQTRRHNAHLAIYRARRRANPVSYEELSDILDIWVDAALALPEMDLRKMMRLAAAQDRRMESVSAPRSSFAAS
ncbi:crotonase/enoyl-CoA hydratase family protein [Roseomonas hellenica]|uniref:Crotonase/enoyl-CoA hydratase family protein n=1 Tax=Plastoroseomonas hellenica TaxID=2687306 RepID=A0ABS5EZ78_9PROT|nr:crotonase/enoyl-CoA hydratase family protein [Plastoroseomonas hellenica]MBR0665615.1 crotonase/enoyl-CoA hydratase family protein [Plastoroseomonas hellenica]